MYTFSETTGQLSLGASTTCDDAIEVVPARVVGTVRAIAHQLGCRTPNWREPVAINDVRIKIIPTTSVAAPA